ncbi:contractile injection system tape measure protein [Chitinophaga sedimenti]|uniref:contractile injection system tape measure protein n=1 Tax=Chitinophaga sedimenti TaxID=2033606 RepID=UPI00249E3B71|nr:contractile injection system tape measure protein [Chitinophaga sedimenti]
MAEQATAAVARVSQEAQCLDGWFYFLGKGTLPWWQSPTGSQTLEQQWIAAARAKPVLFRERWYRAWAHRQINVPRWLEQSSPAWRQVMLEALCPAPLIEYYRQLERDMGSVKYAAWHSFFDFLDAGHQYKPEAESLLRIFWRPR